MLKLTSCSLVSIAVVDSHRKDVNKEEIFEMLKVEKHFHLYARLMCFLPVSKTT